MEWTGIVQETPVIVPEGMYKATLSSIEQDETKNKKMVRVGFTIEDEDYEGEEIYGLCSGTINEISKLAKWIKAMTGHLPAAGEEIKASSLLNSNCRLVVSHTIKGNGTTFANVANVLPRQINKDQDTIPTIENKNHS